MRGSDIRLQHLDRHSESEKPVLLWLDKFNVVDNSFINIQLSYLTKCKLWKKLLSGNLPRLVIATCPGWLLPTQYERSSMPTVRVWGNLESLPSASHEDWTIAERSSVVPCSSFSEPGENSPGLSHRRYSGSLPEDIPDLFHRIFWIFSRGYSGSLPEDILDLFQKPSQCSESTDNV